MNAPARGRALLAADRGVATGGLLGRLVAPAFARVLDSIDRGLAAGEIALTLPDGSTRRLGGRASGPRAEVELRSYRALARLATAGSVGWYRAWAAGEWASPDMVPLFDLFVRNRRSLGEVGRAAGPWRWLMRQLHRARDNDRSGARRNIAFHYDLGNDFYAAWLDPTMTYSAAVFAEPGESLAAAQERKLRLLLDRLALKPGDHLLEIGCGWGHLAIVAARDYGARVTALTLSPEQQAFAQAQAAAAGLGDRIDFAMCDYRDAGTGFDAVASVEMVEAVGERHWGDFTGAVARALKPAGRAAIQYIAIAQDVFASYAANADFIQTYIFPGGMLLHERRFLALADAAGLSAQARRGHGADYAETLRRWRESFDAAVAEDRLPAGFDARFVDLWRYYLSYCEGGFRGGGIDVAQVTLVRR